MISATKLQGPCWTSVRLPNAAVPLRKRRTTRLNAEALIENLSGAGVDAAAVASQLSSSSSALPQIPEQFLLLGGLGVAVLGLIAFLSMNNSGSTAEGAAASEAAAAPELKREDAVVVIGATGKSGKEAVLKLLAAGRTVIAACRNEERAQKVLLGELGLTAGVQASGAGTLFIESGVDITNPSTLTSELFRGATQVLVAVGPIYENVKGSFQIVDGMTSELVEGEGIANVINKAKELLPKPDRKAATICSVESFAEWKVMDDVIMGGSSSSQISQDGTTAAWEGNLVVEGGGFCGIQSQSLNYDLSGFSGVTLRVKGEGQTFKMNVKTSTQEDTPASAYQATFDTVAGDWTTVRIPWHEFVPVKRAKWDPEGTPLDPSNIANIGFVYSRFEFNGMPNPNYTPGAFKLELESVNAYSEPRPALVLMSSGGLERNAIIKDDAARRAGDIPIVQLNPGGTLNWKYKAEIALRSSGLPYSIIRACGLVTEQPAEPYTLEGNQGDRISGRMSRSDAAEMLVAALGCSAAVGKTIEVRRTFDVVKPGAKQTLDSGDMLRIFLRASLDSHRWRIGLNPFPEWAPADLCKGVMPVPAPAPAQAPAPAAAAADEEVKVAPKEEKVESEARQTEPQPASSSDNGVASVQDNAEEARQWIAKWRAKASNGAHGSSESNGAATSEADNAAEARQWIANWRAKNVAEVKETVGAL